MCLCLCLCLCLCAHGCAYCYGYVYAYVCAYVPIAVPNSMAMSMPMSVPMAEPVWTACQLAGVQAAERAGGKAGRARPCGGDRPEGGAGGLRQRQALPAAGAGDAGCSPAPRRSALLTAQIQALCKDTNSFEPGLHVIPVDYKLDRVWPRWLALTL